MPDGATGCGSRIPPNRFVPGGMDVPREYPELPDGSKMPFSPHAPPRVTRGDVRRVLRKHGHGSRVPGKSKFPKSWSVTDIQAAIELTMCSPDHPVEKFGEQLRFERVVDGVLMRVHIRTYPRAGGESRFWSAYPVIR